ncbi:MAG: D-glycero-beta-D-manno-heptose-7-phosphate kinase [Deltaproteobacteria bacterium]|jgi:D-beta-D-heptose 7-phosphate kinase/D-beta-D-heptose 1-phosphate adenosyltransferase|nr:D-glycero-beta-D-manno-heptose-7-phosphate kinase [Deltaproteobacteria bacterium]
MLNRTQQTLQKIASAKVLCLGDLMLDRYIYGLATRLSPEAPVPIINVKRKTHMPGGLGNVVMNVKSLGGAPMAVGLAGRDAEAETLKLLLEKAVDPLSPPLIQDPDRPTTIKTRIIAGIQQVARFDEESQSPLSDQATARYQQAVLSRLDDVSAVVLSDYGKGVLSTRMCAWVLDQADKRGKPVVVDPKGSDYGRYRGADLVTPNRQELALAAGRDIARSPQEVLTEAGLELMKRHGLKNLLITRSEDGMTLLLNSGEVRHFPTKAKEVFDVSGAGDTVVAAMSCALAANLSLEAGAEIATLAAAIVVGKVGTATATAKEILDSLSQN